MGSYKEQSKEKNITLIRLVQCPPYKEYVENIRVFSHLKWLHVYYMHACTVTKINSKPMDRVLLKSHQSMQKSIDEDRLSM